MGAFLASFFTREALSRLPGLLWEFFTSKPGIFIVAWSLCWWMTADAERSACARRAEQAQDRIRAAWNAELQRQQIAAQELARAATERAADDDLARRAMQAKIDAYALKERTPSHAAPNAATSPCLVDGDFARVLRGLDAAGAGAGAPRPPRRPGNLR